MRCAVYARKSTDQSSVSADAKSTTRQVEVATEFAVARGWTVVPAAIFIDDNVSGAEFANRPGFVRLMTAVAQKPRPFDVLVMSEESRLGREQIETAFALKQIVTAGIRVFTYLNGQERTLDGPMEKLLLSVSAFADEMERAKAAVRVADAMTRKAKLGYCTGGTCFGYENVAIVGPDGKRSHVERRIVREEAEVVRRIFKMAASGIGRATIAKTLNDEGALAPTPKRGPRGWAGSSVMAVLNRPLYIGIVEYGRRKTRDRWGQRKVTKRPTADVIRVEVPHLRVVDDALWQAVRARYETARQDYLRATGGRLYGRTVGNDSPFLLTGHVSCPQCGSPMQVETRRGGKLHVLACSAFQRRGKTVCGFATTIPMAVAEDLILDAVASDVLQPDVVTLALERAATRLASGAADREQRRARIQSRLATLDAETANLTAAIAGGAPAGPLTEAIAERDAERQRLQLDLAAVDALPRFTEADRAALRDEMTDLLADFRNLLRANVSQGRQLLRKALAGRLTVTPETRDGAVGYRLSGEASVAGLLPARTDAVRMLVPVRGFEPRSRG